MVTVLSPGTVIGGDFVVVRPLDEGGMGAIYLVEQKSTGKTRALKVMHREIAADPDLQKRFEQEARIGARIKSEHVVDVVAAGVDATLRLPYLVMELLDGEDLRHRVDTRGALGPEEVKDLFEQICHALAAAHAAGIVHRDIKPENVFVARSQRAGGAAFDVKVLDFGIAKVTAEAGTKATRGAVGSPLWMAPEQTQPGPVTPAADVWALGLLAYELLTGRRFWRAANENDGTTAQLLREIVLDPIPTALQRAREQGVEKKLPRNFEAWFARCLHRDPNARYANADLAWRAMRRLFDGTPVDSEAFDETIADPSKRPQRSMDATGDAQSYGPAVSPKAIPPETPIASVRNPTPAPPPAAAKGSKMPIVIGAAIAVAGIAFALTRRPPETPLAVTGTAPTAPTAPASASAFAPASASASASAFASAFASASASAMASTSTSAAPATSMARAPVIKRGATSDAAAAPQASAPSTAVAPPPPKDPLDRRL
jgi:serine/threonine protein kinase